MDKISASVLLKGLAPEGFADEAAIDLVTTDSREVRPGCIFVAFPGEKFDGHDFAAKALEEGAEYVVLNHPVKDVPAGKCFLCPDSYRAMMIMGANYRRQFSPKVVGVTGSVGKTTTKQMTYAAIAGFGNTIKTEGNQNNELGLPRTMFRIGKETEYAVVEMGMSHRGEIERLSRCARPDVGIITCIGVSHIGNLGSQENICKAKLEICEGLPNGAPLVLNGDDPFLRAAKLPEHVHPVWFSLGDENADVCALNIRQEDDGMTFTLEDREEDTTEVHIPAMGRHNVANALAAYAAATRLGLNAKRVIAGLSQFQQTGMRQKVVHSKGVDVIEDCYNANPDSMKAALAMFKEYPCKRRLPCWAICWSWARSARKPMRRWANRLRNTAWTSSWPMARRRNARPRLPRLPGWRPAMWIPTGRRQNCCWPGCSPATRCWSRPAGAWRWKKCSKSFTMSKNKKKYQLE